MSERNLEIWARCKSGEMQKDVAAAFGITSARAHQIFHREERRQQLARNMAMFRPKAVRHRPTDMGGPRDEWQIWTPEMQAREFGLL